MEVSRPRTADEFCRYYELRWQVLRAPWGQSRGSERDELEESAEHAVIWAPNGRAMAVGRLHFNTPEEAQIRYMAVAPEVRGQGFGRAIVAFLEEIARNRGATRVVLNSRDAALGFYAGLGYEVVGAGPTMFGEVAHVQMRKLFDRR